MRVCENTLFIALFILLFITFHFLYKHPHISPIIFLSFILSLELLTKKYEETYANIRSDQKDELRRARSRTIFRKRKIADPVG